MNIAVAVSGGADSTCLAFLLKDFCKGLNINLIALIVDHKLRKESTDEALNVKDNLDRMGIKSVILTREETPLTSKIQEKAREDRYKLLLDYCKNHNISHLLLGHNVGDQIETYLMRLEKNNSIVGNSGMSAKIINKNVIILRPLLNKTKIEIKNTLINIGSKEERTIHDYAKLVMKILGVKLKVKYINKDFNGTYRKKLDLTIASSYGWKAKTSIKKGIILTIKDYLERELKLTRLNKINMN
jgi:tRNA(Ile)-lysidine synthetase-like protein